MGIVIGPFSTIKQMNTSAHLGVATQMLCLSGISLLPGDVLVVTTAEQEVTTNETYENAFAWVDLFVSTNINATSAAISANSISSRGGTNITPDQHHFVFHRSGAWKCTSGGLWNVIFAITWDPDLSLDGTINVGDSYGKLEAIVLRN